MKKLFVVEITMTAVVEADDMGHAYSVAYNNFGEIKSDTSIDEAEINVLREVVDEDSLRGTGWNAQCFPYGPGCNTRISEYLNQP